MEAVKCCLKHWHDANGRARRSEYWYFYLFTFLISICINILTSVFSTISETLGLIVSLVLLLVALALCVPSICATIRRLHDIGKSGWFIFISLVPLAGPFILLYFLAQDSMPDENLYGPAPKFDPSMENYYNEV